MLALKRADSQPSKSKLWGNTRALIQQLRKLTWLPTYALVQYKQAEALGDLGAMSDILVRTLAPQIKVYRSFRSLVAHVVFGGRAVGTTLIDRLKSVFPLLKRINACQRL